MKFSEFKEFEPVSMAKMSAAVTAVISTIQAIYSALFPSPAMQMFPKSTLLLWAGVIFAPIIGAIYGLICGFIGAIIYNTIAKRIGGYKTKLKTNARKNSMEAIECDVMQAGKITTVLPTIFGAIIGILGSLILLLKGQVGAAITILIGLPLIILVAGFAAGALAAIVYNFLVPLFGNGIIIYVKPSKKKFTRMTKIEPKPLAMFYAAFGLIGGLFSALGFLLTPRTFTMPSFMLWVSPSLLPALLIVLPVISSFIMAYVMSIAYNKAAEKWEGVDFKI